VTRPSDEPLVGRAADLERLHALLAGVRVGSSAALVLSGDVGMGKSRLLRAVVEAAEGVRPLVVTGYEAEGRFAFSALHDLVRPLLDALPQLPPPQRDALRVAFGLDTGPQPNRFLVGLATMGLLAEAARARPMLIVVDDVQWIDQETLDILTFVARRLDAEGVGLVLGLRLDGLAPPVLSGIPEHRLPPMPEDDMRLLLAASTATAPPPHVAARLVGESEGNPLALVEYVASVTPAQLDGTHELPPGLPIGERLFAHFASLVASLPRPTRWLLLVLAAAGAREPDVTAGACRALGVGPDAAVPAIRQALVTRRARLAFRHPLIRSVVYEGAEPTARRLVHGALADTADDLGRPDTAAWHRALAIEGTDEEVAAGLEKTAGHARGRGGYAAEAMFLTLAARRSDTGGRARARRLLAAARAHVNAGDVAKAEQLLDEAAVAGVSAAQIQAERVDAILVGYSFRTGHEAAMALDAAVRLGPDEADLARRLITGAFNATVLSRQYTVGTTLPEVARALLAHSSPTQRCAPTDLVLDGLATRAAHGYVPAVPILQEALARMAADPELAAERLPSQGSALSTWMAMEDLWDDEFASTTWARMTSWNRAHGAWGSARIGLGSSAVTQSRHGRFDDAQQLFDEAASVGAVVGTNDELLWSVLVEFRAWQGRERETRAMARRMIDFWGKERKYGTMPNFARLALTVLELSLGRSSEALGHAAVVAREDPPGHGTRILPDLVEAATRTGNDAVTGRALDELALRATASGSPWALGLLSRSRALALGRSAEAGEFFEEALARFAATPLRTETARTQLLYGEWLRRRRRRAAAREQLTTAAAAFADMGAALFAGRAGRELAALGDPPSLGVGRLPTMLTEQEQRVAELAATGMTNVEISQRLFISRSTVDYHLSKVFRKLGVTSRRRLRAAMEP
jgi:DNA-binding CsgD family transcriptional regulator